MAEVNTFSTPEPTKPIDKAQSIAAAKARLIAFKVPHHVTVKHLEPDALCNQHRHIFEWTDKGGEARSVALSADPTTREVQFLQEELSK